MPVPDLGKRGAIRKAMAWSWDAEEQAKTLVGLVRTSDSILVEHVEIFHSADWTCAHSAIAQLTGIAEGALDESGDVFEVCAYCLASGCVGEDIEHATAQLSRRGFSLACFSREWLVAESDKELELRHKVLGEKKCFIVFNNTCDVLEKVIVYDLYWMFCKIIPLADVLAFDCKLNGCVDTIEESGEVIHQGNQTNLIKATDVNAIYFEAAAIAAVFENDDTNAGIIIVEQVPDGQQIRRQMDELSELPGLAISIGLLWSSHLRLLVFSFEEIQKSVFFTV